MKQVIKKTFLFVTLLMLVCFMGQAQTQSSPQSSYKDMIGENPDAEADIKVVSDYVNSLVSGDLDKAKGLVTADYKAYGPSPDDSATIDKTVSGWQENYKTQSDRKVNFVTETFRVLSGPYQGDWVSLWGDYTFTQSGKTVTFPLQYTAKVSGGKISTDRIYYDRLYILQSLGYKVTPPGQ